MMPYVSAGADLVALADLTEDAARDQAGDLHDDELVAVFGAQQHGVAFVVVARLVQVGGQELARPVGDPLDHAVRRHALDVHVEHREEHRNAHPRLGGQAELGGRHGLLDQRHEAVGRGERDAVTRRRDALGLAEERGGRHGRQRPDEPEALGEPAREQRRRDAARHERAAGGVHRRQRFASELEGVRDWVAGGLRPGAAHGRVPCFRVGRMVGAGVRRPRTGAPTLPLPQVSVSARPCRLLREGVTAAGGNDPQLVTQGRFRR